MRSRPRRCWGVASVRGVEDTDGATCGAFVPDFLTDGWRDEVVLTVGDLVEEGRADGIDVVGGEDAGGELIDGVLRASGLVVEGWLVVVEVLPEESGVDAAGLDLVER